MIGEKLTAFPVGQDILIVNSEGYCVASSNPAKIGRALSFGQANSLERTQLSLRNTKIDLLYRKKNFDTKELGLIKKMTKLIVEQYLSSSTVSADSVDQLVMEIVEQPLTPDRISHFEMRAQALGLNLEMKRSAIVMQVDDFAENNLSNNAGLDYSNEDVIKTWKRKTILALSNFFTLKADVIAAYLGEGRFVFFKEVIGDDKKFIKNMKSAHSSIFGSMMNSSKSKIHVAFSNTYSGIKGIAESYHESLQALQFGERFAKKKDSSYFYGDLGAIRILTEDNLSKKRKLAKEVLDPLHKKILRLTLETYFDENMDINRTAKRLGVHPNTVSYRIDRIAENLNLNPRVFKQAFELRIALLTDNIFE